MNTPVVTLKTNHPLCVRPLLELSAHSLLTPQCAFIRGTRPTRTCVCRNSSLQASRLTSQKHDNCTQLTFSTSWNTSIRQCDAKLDVKGLSGRDSLSFDPLPRARRPQCVRFLSQPLPMSASCRPCPNCPKMSSLSPLHARRVLPREGDPAGQEPEHGAGSDRIERCAPYRSPR